MKASQPDARHAGRSSAPLAWWLLTLGLVWTTGRAWSAREDEPRPAPSEAQATSRYFCPMHPSYHASEPGICPLCNMDMRAQEGDSTPAVTRVDGHATVELSPARLQLIGVRTETVEERPCTRTLRVPARVAVDETRVTSISLKTMGWVEELFVRSTGAEVAAGETLFTFYSPELFEAQRKYIVAHGLLAQTLASAGAEAELGKRQQVDVTRARLALWDMSDAQVAALEAEGAQPLGTTPILARTGGVVLRRDIAQGGRIEPGQTLFELADLSRVWVLAELWAADLELVAPGNPLEVTLEGTPNVVRSGTIDYLYPTMDEVTRTVRARILLDNADGTLRPGMYATVSIALDLGRALVVDDEAVLDTGLRQLVFVELAPGEFEPREVELGGRFDGQALIRSGLEEGERVVTSGTFLIDSESRLKAALADLGGEAP